MRLGRTLGQSSLCADFDVLGVESGSVLGERKT
jgi:hypothetical protein